MKTEQGSASIQEHQQALLVLLREFDRVCKILNIPYALFAGTMLGAVRHQGFIPWDDDIDVIMHRKDYDRFLKDAPAVLNQETFFLQREFSEHWPLFFSKLRLNGTACIEKYHPKDPQSHQGIYIDIFPLDKAAKSGLGRKLQFCASKVVIAKALFARGYDTDSHKKKCFMTLCRLLPLKPFWKLTVNGSDSSNYVHSFFAAARSFKKNVYPKDWFAERISMPFEGEHYPIFSRYDELLKHIYGDYLRLPDEGERAAKQHAILVDLHRSYAEYEHWRDGMRFDVPQRSIR